MQIMRIEKYQQCPQYAVTFHVFFQSGEVTRVSAADLLSYRRFQAAVLEQTGKVFKCLWITKDFKWEDEVARRMVRPDRPATAA